MISFFALDVCVAMDTAAHDASSSDLDESGLEHVFVCGVKKNTCDIMPVNYNAFHICSVTRLCEKMTLFIPGRCGLMFRSMMILENRFISYSYLIFKMYFP